VIAGALLYLSSAFSLTVFQEEMIAAIPLLGALFGASSIGPLARQFDRRTIMFLSTLAFFSGSLFSSLAHNCAILLLGRFLIGLAAGGSSVIVPLFLMDSAPAEKRGAIVYTNQLMMAIGMLSAYISGYLFSDNWRWMFGLGAVFAAIHFIGLFFIPRKPSPKYKSQFSFKQLLTPAYAPRVRLAIGLIIFQQITGIMAVYFFAPQIFEQTGFNNPSDAILATCFLGAINTLAIFISFWLVDRLGRRPLLLTGLAGMIFSLLGLAYSFTDPLHASWIALGSLSVYIASYAVGLGPIPLLYIGEICAPHMRGHLTSLAGGLGWIFNYLTVSTFLTFLSVLTPPIAFCLYAFFGLLAFLLVALKMPETKGKTIEEIEKDF
jgi:MFS family permease